ncbi:histidine-specific methyltransferase [Aspergillus karnatakaensis]|uniref:class I SAM-dependent methyltransferase n=1 Tax=Aspergillus karnatakaensis TaxID=1810916 RepID=UPI003CCCAB2A
MFENISTPRTDVKPAPVLSDSAGHIIDIRSDTKDIELRESLQQSIRNDSAALPDLLLWDEKGLKYFEDVTYCPSYYLTREEIRLLGVRRFEIAQQIQPGSMIIELGSGNLRKTKILLDALEDLGRPVDYFALDVSRPELQRTLRPVTAGVYRHVRCFGLWGTYDDGRKWLQSPEIQARPKTILYLGSTLGNFEKDDAAQFLSSFALSNCSFLLGLDGCKEEAKVLQAYNDTEGVNHRFIKNGLARANTILGGDTFDLDVWDVSGSWNEEKGAHEQYYYPRKDVYLDGVHIPAGRKLLAVKSHKYDADDREGLCKRSGLTVSDAWTAAVSGYSLLFLTQNESKS